MNHQTAIDTAVWGILTLMYSVAIGTALAVLSLIPLWHWPEWRPESWTTFCIVALAGALAAAQLSQHARKEAHAAGLSEAAAAARTRVEAGR
jgi:hypothetical protein